MADTLTALLKAIADRAATVPGVKAAHYPAPNALQSNKLPAAVVFSGTPNGESVIQDNLGGQRIWLPAVMLQIYGKPRRGNTAPEFSTVDQLILPVVDAFEQPLVVSVDGRRVHIDRCHVTGFRGTLNLEYAGVEHYGAEIYLSIKFRRPIGG